MKRRVLSGVVALLAVASATAADLTDGLVTWFSFDVKKASGEVQNLVDAKRSFSLKTGTSLTNASFNGTSALFCDGQNGARGTFAVPALTNLTFSMWVRRDTDVGVYPDSSYPRIINGVPGDISIVMSKTTSSSTIYVGGTNFGATAVLARKMWQHHMMTFEEVSRDDASSWINYRLYVNGQLAQELLNVRINGFLGKATDTTVSLAGNGGNRPFTGIIDEFRFWNRALTPEEALAEYRRQSVPMTDALVCRWKFDEIAGFGSARTAADSGRYGATMTLGDGVTATNGVLQGAVRTDGTTKSWASLNLPKRMSEMTLCGWANQSVESSLDNEAKIGGSNGGPRFFACNGGYFIFEASPKTTSSPSKWPGAVVDEAHTFNPSHPAQGVWFHFALTTHYELGDGDYQVTQRYYLNGELTAENTFATTTPWWANENQGAFFFNQGKNSNRPFEGLTDDLRLYDRVLSVEEIAQLARGPATVDAGADFTVASETAVLRGAVGPRAPESFSEGYAGTPAWSLVSAPAGGEAAAILVPESATTRVTLPVAGAYVFRLTVTAADVERHDEVTVTRTATPAAAAPTVTLAAAASVDLPFRLALEGTAAGAERVRWSKVSGPAGVWFEPSDAVATKVTFGAVGTYVLRLTAENSAGAGSADVTVTATATDGMVELDRELKIHWGMDGGSALSEYVSKTRVSLQHEPHVETFEEGARRYGVRNLKSDDCIKTDRNLSFEATESGGLNQLCTNEWVTVAMWIRPDEVKQYDSWSPILFLAWQSLGLRYGRWNNNADGFTLIQQTDGGGNYALYFNAPSGAPMAGRWVHVCAIYDRATTNGRHELYVDGVKLTAATSGGSPNPARKMGTNVQLGGAPTSPNITGTACNQALGNYGSKESYKSATFEGLIDDVRVYGRKLNLAEIRTLASRPDVVNFAPDVAIDGDAVRRVGAPTTEPVAGTCFDDGVPAGSACSLTWRFVGTAPQKASFADPSAASTTVSFRKGGLALVQLVATDGERTTYSDPIAFDVLPPGFLLFLK